MKLTFPLTNSLWHCLIFIFGFSFSTTSIGQSNDALSLPEPLTLESLMSLPMTISPQVQLQQAKQNQAVALLEQQQSIDAFELNVIGRLGWREFANETQNNHQLALHLGKQLYDFGRQTALTHAQQHLANAEDQSGLRQQHYYQLQLMQAFFNVILADYQYRVQNEAMAVAYVTLDKAKDRHALQQISDVSYLKLQNDYEKILLLRSKAEYEQRRTRSFLANLVGQPQQLSDKLVFPKLDAYTDRVLPSLETLQQQILSNSLQLKALKLQLQAALSQLQGEEVANYPVFRLDAWGGQLSSYEKRYEGNWRVDLSMQMPLVDGGLKSASVANQKAKVNQIQAEIAAMEQALRDEAATLFFDLKLAKAERKQVQLQADYADLYLDFSRALYENESQTDLGDSMVQLSESNYQIIAQQFKQVLAWAQLDFLSGQPPFNVHQAQMNHHEE
ncbi:TolC family protein [Hydrogenovibrio sp. SC-1]|uniref:TolC family protein n=1 Tax=Hydrogenovibrio sp. SC-1 TaxID=2065820 RepID=UPI0013042224|nr:TolC family protein [Hydrogenovibrio sp. SC-1]